MVARALASIACITLAACAAGSPDACTTDVDCDRGARCVEMLCTSLEPCEAHEDCTVPPCGHAECVDGACNRVPDDRDCGIGRVCDVTRGCVVVDDAGPGCVPGAETCNGTDDDCDTRVDEGDQICIAPSGTAVCDAGVCRVSDCPSGTDDCDGRVDNGCEADLGSPATCGACDASCVGATPLCARSEFGASCVDACAGVTPLECDGRCVDPSTDTMHCGACATSCVAPHRTGTCAASVCAPGACDPGFGDCDGGAENGCESSLASTDHCGACGVRCDTPGLCRTLPGACESGACVYPPAAASVECRASSSACDAAERCDGAGGCAADGVSGAGVQCRAAACAGDLPEACDGSTTVCAASCGCGGEPCCGGTCGTDLRCVSGTCRACTTSAPSWSGSAGVAGTTWLTSVSAAGNTLTFGVSDGTTMSSASVSVGGGVTMSGAFTPASGIFYSVAGSASTITFTDWSGTPSVSITLTGATASGSFIPPTSCGEFGCFNGYLAAVAASGGQLVFYDYAGGSGAITLSPVETCL